MVLKAPRRAIPAEIEVGCAIRVRLGHREPGRLEKTDAFRSIKPPERLQRSGKTAVDPDAVFGGDQMDLSRQSQWRGKKVKEKRGDDTIDRGVGKSRIEGVHGGQGDVRADRSPLAPAQNNPSRLVDSARQSQINALPVKQMACRCQDGKR
jgi:hypothetical protein